MTTTNISAAKKTFGLALVVGICFVCLVALFNNTRSFEMQIVPKPYLFMYQEKPNSAQGPGNAKDATTASTSVPMPSTSKKKEWSAASKTFIKSSYETVEERQIQRIQHVKNICAKHKLTGDIVDKDIRFVYSKKYNFAYFPIAKIGSTFLKQMFMVLFRGQDQASDIYSIARMNVHTSNGGIYHRLNASAIHDAFVIVPTRNPYTRLYSAYVDKVFLPIAVFLANDVGRVTGNGGPCGRNQTFTNFLRYALRPVKGRILADHYGSPYNAASGFVCSLKNFMLVQQETFSEDVELALQNAGVDKKEFDVIYDMLHDHRADATIPGIVKTIYAKSKPHESCYPRSEVARRTWKSFQIQGFLHSDINFPEHEFRSNTGKNLYAEPDYVTQVILKYVRLRPMTSAEIKAQRRASMLDAYKAVDKDILKKIHDMYAMDFEMYQYDTDVNSV